MFTNTGSEQYLAPGTAKYRLGLAMVPEDSYAVLQNGLRGGGDTKNGSSLPHNTKKLLPESLPVRASFF